jgi:colanic acid biosynthesis glycosyl transferase WcaI
VIHLHDFSGHPFQAQLSREFSRRGYQVDHTYSSQYASGKGNLAASQSDSRLLSFRAVGTKATFHKYSPLRRIWFEWSYGGAWIRDVKRTQPDIVISCNVPLLALARFAAFCWLTRRRWYLWHQDVFSIALSEEMRRRLPSLAARSGSKFVTAVERSVVRSAARVVAIGDEFVNVYREWGLSVDHVTVIPNWAPTSEIVPEDRDNSWANRFLSRGHQIRIVYAGTLGRKHNPELLIELLQAVRAAGIDAELVVVSEGESAGLLDERGQGSDLPVTVLPFQPSDALSKVLGSADVLVALLELEASRFSIPSKVLSYLAAGRPIVGLMPLDNPAASDILESGGVVASPDSAGVRQTVHWLARQTPEMLSEVGTRARSLAVDRFGIDTIADRFAKAIDLVPVHTVVSDGQRSG